MTREGLIDKYQAMPGVDVRKIESVDFVWSGGLLSDAVPTDQHGTFDVLLASHVIEHTPDLIAFFKAAQVLLREEGVIILAVPDKRYCFDYFQPVSTTGQVLEAHANQRISHTGARGFDHFAYAVTDGGAEAWGRRPSEGLRLIHTLEESVKQYEAFDLCPFYQDLHAWYFVPSSFELLLLELGRIGKIDWRILRIMPDMGLEFFAWLRRGAAVTVRSMSVEELNGRRMTLLKRTLLETQEQIDWLIASEPELTSKQGGLSTWATPIRYQQAEANLQRCQADLTELRARVATVEGDYATAMQQVAAFRASTFWRATAPFRYVLERVRRVG